MQDNEPRGLLLPMRSARECPEFVEDSHTLLFAPCPTTLCVPKHQMPAGLGLCKVIMLPTHGEYLLESGSYEL